MKQLTYILLCDGSSDRALIPIINWIIRQHNPQVVPKAGWDTFNAIPKLTNRIQQTIDTYPCDWLFIHRDAEKQSLIERQREIETAWQRVNVNDLPLKMVSVIPVQMTEAWLLFDERAIRKAASNPNGQQKLSLPPLKKLEDQSAKKMLKQVLRQASELTGRRLEKFIQHEQQAIQRVADEIQDFSPLRALPAFRTFEETVKDLLLSSITS